MPVCESVEEAAVARRLRWFGIDREAKLLSRWENDIKEVGYKYQMTDIAASLGLAGLVTFDETLEHRKQLLKAYAAGLAGIAGVEIVGRSKAADREHAAWTCTILAERRVDLQRKLRDVRIESDPVHFRNDQYAIFERFRRSVPNMDRVEKRYLVLPLHTNMTLEDVQRVCETIRSGWGLARRA